MKNFKSILEERTDCILYSASPGPSEQASGWIGGNAPAYFDDKADDIHEDNKNYYFYLSIVHPFKPASMISIFIPKDYEKYVKHNQYPECSIKVMEHAMTDESLNDHFAHPDLTKHLISHRETCSDLHSMDQSFLIKLGYYSAKLREEGRPCTAEISCRLLKEHANSLICIFQPSSNTADVIEGFMMRSSLCCSFFWIGE